MFKFPYTNLHELNLDWILEKVKKFSELIPPMETAVEDVQGLQTDVEQAVEDANQAVQDAQSAIQTAEEAKEIAEQAAQGTIADGAVTTAKLADDAVTAVKIADGTITGAKLADGTVYGAKIAPATIQTGNLSEGCVTSTQILDETIQTIDIADNAVTNAKMADNAVNTLEIVNGAVTNPKIADDAVSLVKLDTTLRDKINALGNYINSVSVNTTVPPNTVTNLRSLTLAKGTWIVSGYFNFADGFNENARGYLITTGTVAQVNLNGQGGGAFSLCAVVHVNAETICYMSAWHQATASHNTSSAILNAIQVGE